MATKILDISDIIEFSDSIFLNILPVISDDHVKLLDLDPEIEMSRSNFIVEPPVVVDPNTKLLDLDPIIEMSNFNFVNQLPIATGLPTKLFAYVPFEDSDPFGDPPISTNVIMSGEKLIDFVGVPNRGDKPLVVQFTPIIPDYASVVEWDFGDGDTSAQTAPEHIYAEAGEYEVTLTVEMFSVNHTGKRKLYIKVLEKGQVPDLRVEETRGTIFENTFKREPKP